MKTLREKGGKRGGKRKREKKGEKKGGKRGDTSRIFWKHWPWGALGSGIDNKVLKKKRAAPPFFYRIAV